MKIQPDILFRQVRRRIVDEDDLPEGLQAVWQGMSDIIPAGKISWLRYHFDQKIIRIIAQASAIGCEKTDFTYDVPGDYMTSLCGASMPEIHAINQPETDPVGKELCKRANLFDWSCLLISFRNSAGTYGGVLITVDGRDRYTGGHAGLLAGLLPALKLVLDAVIAEDQHKTLNPARKEPVEDKNEFFRQATRRLCGQLDLEIGVARCLQYLSRFLPADALFVRQLEPELQSDRLLAESFGVFHQHTGTLVPWSAENRNPAGRRRVPRMRIINRSEESSTLRLYKPMFANDICCISMPLIHQETQLGFAVLGLEGRDRYNDEHRQLFAMLHDPFVLALSNNIKHREVIRLKNLIEAEKKDLREALHDTGAHSIIGASLGFKGVMDNARLVAGTDSPVLLSGETGSGKEVVANFIHQQSSRKDGPLIKVNCGAIPETLLDSELFGHEKGAFTGAVSRKKGRFERAHKGTIFLDEIAELPLPAQVRLLRVLQHKIIERVGGTEAIPVDVRIIAATHRNLEEMVASGKFREDLWFRLNVFPIRIPPLRSRRSDIPALVDHFIEKKSLELKFRHKRSLSPDAMGRLIAYEWPGNVRELENVVERELILNKGGPLTFQNVSSMPLKDNTTDAAMTPDHILSLDDVFARHVKQVLTLSKGKIDGPGGAAELLGIKSGTLRSRMKKLGIPYGGKRDLRGERR